MSYESALADHYRSVRSRLFGLKPPRPPRRFTYISAADTAPPRKPLHIIAIDNLERKDDDRPIVEVKALLWREIVAQVAQKHGVSLVDLVSKRRDRAVVEARQEAFWRLKNETPMSLPGIGRRFNRDHTTVLHGIRKYQRQLKESGDASPSDIGANDNGGGQQV